MIPASSHPGARTKRSGSNDIRIMRTQTLEVIRGGKERIK